MGGYVSQLQAMQDDIATIKQTMPIASTLSPSGEVVVPTAGTDPLKFSQEGHAHPRLSSAQYATTNVNGLASVTFTRSFVNKPCPLFCADNMDGVTCTVTSWVQDGNGNYTGCTFRATKRTATTNTTGVTVVGIPVIASVTTTNADVIAPNQLVSVIMLQQS